MRKDVLRIEDLMIYGRIGVSAEERSYPQRMLISIELGADLSAAAEKGDIKAGICYATLARHYEELVQSREWTLVEELSNTLIESTFATFPLANEITVRIKKFAVPNCTWVGVESYRTRG